MLELRNVHFGLHGRPLLIVDSLTVRRSEVVCFIGKTGSGKTTMLRTIAGLTEPLSGQIMIDSRIVDTQRRIKLTALSAQRFPLFHWQTVRENISLAARVRKVAPERVDEVIAQLTLNELKNKLPSSLSGGQRCAASLAQAMLAEPHVFLLDEPFTGLDPVLKDEVRNHVFSIARARNAAAVWVTHDLDDACKYADRVFVLSGREPSRVVTTHDTSAAQVHTAVFNSFKQHYAL